MTVSKSKSGLPQFVDKELHGLLESQLERSRTTARNHKRLKRIIAARRSGKPTPREYSCPDADERLFKGIKASLDAKQGVRLTAKKGGLVEDFRFQKTRKHLPKTLQSKTHIRTFRSPHWDHTNDRLKALAWSKVAHMQGGYALSMNLGDEVIASIRAKGPGFAKHLSERIRTYLRRYVAPYQADTPEFFFWIETTARIPIHLHGAIIIHNDNPAVLAAVEKALDGAAGNWKPHASTNKVHMKPIYTPHRWVSYVSKWQLGTRIRIGDDNIAAATNGLRRAARRWYEEARRTGEVLS